eukprot:7830395-Pyramimonas_sp.AAC.1
MRGCKIEECRCPLYPLLRCNNNSLTRGSRIGQRCLEPDSGGRGQDARYAHLCPVGRPSQSEGDEPSVEPRQN